MGTFVRIKVTGPGAASLADAAVAEIQRLDRLFNRFDKSSEISRINILAGRSAVRVSPDTLKIIELAVKFNRLSEGAFDITLGKPQALIIDEKRQTMFLNDRKAKLDLGGIGKGYAVEAARELLLKRGAKSGMIDMHSSLAVFGPRTWRIGVQHPRRRAELLGIVELKAGESLSTSGDYEQGKHIIDPRTGRPAAEVEAVTLIGRQAAELDALSTAIFVLGPDRGLRLLKTWPGRKGLIVDDRGRISQTTDFRMLTNQD